LMRTPINHGALPVPPANRTPAAERSSPNYRKSPRKD
jgi:hypothetical protein